MNEGSTSRNNEASLAIHSIKLYNLALRDTLAEREYDLTALNNLIYSTAKAVTTRVGIKIGREPHMSTNLQSGK